MVNIIIENRFERIDYNENHFLIEDYYTGDDYSIEKDGTEYLCIDNHDNCIERWSFKPSSEHVIKAIKEWLC